MKRFLKSWLQIFTTGAPCGKNRSKHSRGPAKHAVLGRDVENLEHRIVPVVGFNYQPGLASGYLADGVAQILASDGSYGSGVLLADRRHILTAGHVVDSAGGRIRNGTELGDGVVDDLTFTAIFGTPNGTYSVALTASNVTLAPYWTGDYLRNDLALFTLPEQVPGFIPGYDIYREQDEVGQPFMVVGLGGTGNNGVDGSLGGKRFGYNVFDTDVRLNATTATAGILNPNYSSGTYLEHKLDHAGEAIIAGGDSGGPSFIGNKIAAITSYGNIDETNLVGATAGAVRVSMYSKWIDEVMGVNRNLVIDTRTLPGEADNGRADRIEVQTNAYGDMLIATVNNLTVFSGSLRQIDSITIYGSSDVDVITIGAGVNRVVNVDGRGNADTLNVDGLLQGFSRADYVLEGSTITTITSNGTAAITFSGITSLNLYTQAGMTTGEPSIVTVNSRVPAYISIYTGSGLFSVNVNSAPSGGVNVITGTGKADITVNAAGMNFTGGQVRISGTGRNTLTINDALNYSPVSVVVAPTSVVLTTNVGAAGRLYTSLSVTFDQNFIASLTVVAGTPIGSTTAGNTFLVKDTPSRVFGSTTVSLFTGFGDDDVRIEAINSPVSLFGQEGNDTVTVGKNGSMTGIRYSLGITNDRGSTQINLGATADNWSHTVEVNTSGWGNYITGLSAGPILYGFTGISGVNIATGAYDDTFNVRYSTATLRIAAGAGRDTINVDAVAPDAMLDIDGGTGRNTVHIGASGYLNTILGQVQTRAVGGSNILYLDDRNTQSPMKVSLTGDAYIREGLIPILFANADTLIIWSGSGGNQFDVLNTPANAYTTLNTGNGYDAVRVSGTTGYLYVNFEQGPIESLIVGGPEYGLDRIQGIVRIVSDSGMGMSVTVDDTGTAVGQRVVIDRDALHRSGVADLNFGFALDFPLFYLGGSGDDTIEVQGKRGNLGLRTGEGNDRIFIGTAAGTIADLGHFIIDGEGGDDTVILEDRGAAAGRPYDFFNPVEYPGIPIATAEGSTFVFAAFDGFNGVKESSTEAVVLYTNSAASAVPVSWTPQTLRLFINSEPTFVQAQKITFDALANTVYGSGSIALAATASSGLPITYRVVSGPAEVVDNVLTITGAGVVVVAASQTGDEAYKAAASVEQTFTVNKAYLKVTANSQSRVFGQTQAFTATITGFVNGDSLASSVTGVAAFNSNATLASAVGVYTITVTQGSLNAANYDFNSMMGGTLTVQKAATTVLLQSNASPSTVGRSITFTARVSAASPGSGVVGGTVTFKNGATVLGTGTLTNGVATFQTTALALGSSSITAVYAGNGNYTTKTSSVLTQSVLQASKATLQTSLATSKFGQAITLTATIAAGTASGTPTGTVTFMDGAVKLGTATLSGGKATFATTALRVGARAITVVYSGNATFGSITSAVLTQNVTQAATTTVLSSSAATSAFGKSITLTAKIGVVAPGAALPTGTVTFKDGATVLGTATVTNGIAVFTTTKLSKGKHSLTVVYSGDVNLTASTSVIFTQTIT